MNTVTFHRQRLVSAGFQSAKPLFTMALMGLLVSCSPGGYVYQEMGKEDVPPPVTPQAPAEAPPQEEAYVELVETEHIHGPGCGHYFYDGQWHEAALPEQTVGIVAEASPEEGFAELSEGQFEIHPPLSTAPGYEPVEQITESPEVVVNIYEPDYYPAQPVIEEYYYPARVYYYDYYYPYDPWDYWSFSFSYGGGCSSYWGVSIGYHPYTWWRYSCWDPWWYSRWWCGFTYYSYPWRYCGDHYPHHYYDRDYYHHRDHDDHHPRDHYDGDTRDQRYPGASRVSRPLVDADVRQTHRDGPLVTAERSAARPLIPVSAEPMREKTRQRVNEVADGGRSPRPVKILRETPDRNASRAVRATVETTGTRSLQPSLPGTSAIDLPRDNRDSRSVVNVSEERRGENTARLPAETRGTSVERLPRSVRTLSEPANDRPSEPGKDYGFRLTAPSREQSTARESTRASIERTESRGVIVVPNPPARSSPERRPVTVVPPETRRPVVTSSVRTGPSIVSRTETTPRVSTRSEPARLPSSREISVSEPRRQSSPSRIIERSEPSRVAPSRPAVEESRPRVEPPPRVEAPRVERSSSPPPRSISPPSRSPSRPPSSPRTVGPRSVAPSPRSVPRPEVRAPSRPSAPSAPRGSRTSGRGVRIR